MSNLPKKRRVGTVVDYRITRGYLAWLKWLFWDNVDGPVFDCLMEWSEDDILLLQTIRSLGVKYRDRVARLYPYGFNARNRHPEYHYKAYVDLNDQTARLVNAPVFLDGLVKIKIVYRLCLNGCYALGIMMGDTRELVIVEIVRDVTTPPGLTILSPYYNDIVRKKYRAYQQTIHDRFPMIYSIREKEEGLKLYPSGECYHYISEKGKCGFRI